MRTPKSITVSLTIISVIAGFCVGWSFFNIGDLFRMFRISSLIQVLFPLIPLASAVIIYAVNSKKILRKGMTIWLNIILPIVCGFIAFMIVFWGLILLTVIFGGVHV